MRRFASALMIFLVPIAGHTDSTRSIGTAVKSGGSPSTCAIIHPNFGILCSATLQKDGRFRTAGHCVRDERLLQNSQVSCGGAPGSFTFESKIKAAKVHPKNRYPASEKDVPFDSALFEVVDPLPDEKVLPRAIPIEAQDLSRLFDPSSDPAKLRGSTRCWFESYGPDEKGKHALRSSEVHPLEYNAGYIQYKFPGVVSRADCAECFQAEREELFDTAPLVKIVKALDVKFLTIFKDSGGPLYCEEGEVEKKTYLVGVLHGSMSRFEKKLSKRQLQKLKSRDLRLGSAWAPLYPDSELQTSWQRKK